MLALVSRIFARTCIGFAMTAGVVHAAPVVRSVSGLNPADIQAAVDQFRADLGGAAHAPGGSFPDGRREINWDGVGDAVAEPNNIAANFFNTTSPRGIVFNSIEDSVGDPSNAFSVSAKVASGVAVRFGNINPAYTNTFKTFSAERLFIARDATLMEATFYLPGTVIPATVNGFGAVFSDVDTAAGRGRTFIRCYGIDNKLLATVFAEPFDNGLSFAAVSFDAGEQIARVVIQSGNAPLSIDNTDGGNGVDVVAMDDFIYGEPHSYDTLFANGLE